MCQSISLKWSFPTHCHPNMENTWLWQVMGILHIGNEIALLFLQEVRAVVESFYIFREKHTQCCWIAEKGPRWTLWSCQLQLSVIRWLRSHDSSGLILSTFEWLQEVATPFHHLQIQPDRQREQVTTESFLFFISLSVLREKIAEVINHKSMNDMFLNL